VSTKTARSGVIDGGVNGDALRRGSDRRRSRAADQAQDPRMGTRPNEILAQGFTNELPERHAAGSCCLGRPAVQLPGEK
jgi:hypothetical protein